MLGQQEEIALSVPRPDEPAEEAFLRRTWLCIFGLDDVGIALALALFFIVGAVSNSYFLSVGDLTGILQNVAFLGFLSSGVGLALMAGEIHISVGSIFGLASVSTALLLKAAYRVSSAVAAGLKRPHPHAVLAPLGNRFIVVCDPGLDQLVVYRSDAATGNIARIADTALPPGSGPRHFLFHPSDHIAYRVNERNSTVASLSFDGESERMALLTTASTARRETLAYNRCSEIQLSPNNQFPYVGNSGNDDLAVFRLGAAGALTTMSAVLSGGKTSRHFAFDHPGDLWPLRTKTATSSRFSQLILTSVNSRRPIATFQSARRRASAFVRRDLGALHATG
jgi:hypothetical protein